MIGISMQTILITGINGFLGSSLAKKLAETYHIIGLESSYSNTKRLAGNNFKTYNISDPLEVIFTEQRIHYIIHTATLFGRNNELISEIIKNNLLFPVTLTETAKKYGIMGFINTHTALSRNTNNYSLSKSQFLDWLPLFQNDMQIINVLPEHFYGPEASDSNFVNNMIKKMMANVPSIDLTPGEQRRDFIYIDDIVEAFCLIVKNLGSLPLYSEFEIGSDEILPIKEVVLTIHKLTKSGSVLNFGALPYRENELMQSECNNLKIRQLGWKPTVKFEMGVKNIIEHYKSKNIL
jgi:CDP-paratose synthetase